jgi:hypothetical protein
MPCSMYSLRCHRRPACRRGCICYTRQHAQDTGYPCLARMYACSCPGWKGARVIQAIQCRSTGQQEQGSTCQQKCIGCVQVSISRAALRAGRCDDGATAANLLPLHEAVRICMCSVVGVKAPEVVLAPLQHCQQHAPPARRSEEGEMLGWYGKTPEHLPKEASPDGL